MSTLDVVAEVLREVAPRALKAREITALAGARLPTASRTPETVVSRDLAIDVRDRGAASRFLRVDRGAFVLKEALPTAFFNDVDAYASQWTRNLIAAGEIAAGVVDERSIRDLKPADVASYRQCHFFSGIGVWSRALRDAGWPDDAHVWTGSCPCGPWSQAGQKRGFDDEQHLWPEWFRLIDACRPTVIFGEQVASKDGLAWLDVVLADLESASYTVRAFDLCAAWIGAPHLRQRIYFVAISRERGREVLGAPWLHDRGQSRDDAARRGAPHDGAPVALPNAAGARCSSTEDSRADRGDEGTRSETHQRRSAGNLEPQRGGADDGTGTVSDSECVVWDERRSRLPHGRPEVEPDRHGEADGAGLDDCSSELGDAGRDGAGEHGRELPGDETQHDERPAFGDHTPVVASAAYRPGDRIRIAGDPTWGGAVGGYWALDVEWIYCRPAPGHENGCFRPAESGTQPLVDEPAPGMGGTRAKRLRGYGNAIVRAQAVAFVEAALDALMDAARASGMGTHDVETRETLDEAHAPLDEARAEVHGAESAA